MVKLRFLEWESWWHNWEVKEIQKEADLERNTISLVLNIFSLKWLRHLKCFCVCVCQIHSLTRFLLKYYILSGISPNQPLKKKVTNMYCGIVTEFTEFFLGLPQCGISKPTAYCSRPLALVFPILQGPFDSPHHSFHFPFYSLQNHSSDCGTGFTKFYLCLS